MMNKCGTEVQRCRKMQRFHTPPGHLASYPGRDPWHQGQRAGQNYTMVLWYSWHYFLKNIGNYCGNMQTKIRVHFLTSKNQPDCFLSKNAASWVISPAFECIGHWGRESPHDRPAMLVPFSDHLALKETSHQGVPILWAPTKSLLALVSSSFTKITWKYNKASMCCATTQSPKMKTKR